MTHGVPYLAARIEHGEYISDHLHAMAQEVGAILMRPCFAPAEVLSACRAERLVFQTRPTAERTAAYLCHPANEAISLCAPGKASIEIASGNDRTKEMLRATSLYAFVAVPVLPGQHEALLRAICDLARALRAAAGFIAMDTRFSRALQLALLGLPVARSGLGEQRQHERQARWYRAARTGSELAGVEWGTFLGSAHLRKVDLDAVRASGAFATVQRFANDLAYLQVTRDPMDDLSGALEEKLPAARRALAPLMMTTSAASLSLPEHCVEDAEP